MPAYQWDFASILQYRDVLASGIGMTLRVLALSLTMGMVLGLALAPLRAARTRWLRWPAQGVIEVVRTVPPLVLLVWAYYCLPILTPLKLSAYWTCVLALGTYGSVFFAEIFRSGLQSVDHGMVEAALAVGMTPLKALVRISAPIAFLRILPAFVGQCVMSIKNSVLGS